MTSSSTLCFLQNQWFKDPERVKRLIATSTDPVARALFAGCHTGRVLRRAFGDLCDSIIWEECSPEIGGHASSKFPPDEKHIAAAIARHNPDIVICLSAPAREILHRLCQEQRRVFLAGPHPAARAIDVFAKLQQVAILLRTMLASTNPRLRYDTLA